MRKLKWRNKGVGIYDPRDRAVSLSTIQLTCNYWDGGWESHVRFNGRSRFGECFGSLEAGKEGCVLLAKQILLEYHECLAKIMKSFDLEAENE